MKNPEVGNANVRDILVEDETDAERLVRINALLEDVHTLIENMADPRDGARAVHLLDQRLDTSRARWAQERAKLHNIVSRAMASTAIRNN